MGFQGGILRVPGLFKGIERDSWSSREIKGVPEGILGVSVGDHGLPEIFKGFKGWILGILEGCMGFQGESLGSSWIHGVPGWIIGVPEWNHRVPEGF